MSCKQCDAHLLARAEQAERSLATVTAERDEARAWHDEWHGALQRIQAALAPKFTNKWWTTDEMEAEVMRLRDDFRAMQRERDEARAALAMVHRDVCRGDGHGTPAMTAMCVASAFASAQIDHVEELDALKAKLAEAERDAHTARSVASRNRTDAEALRAQLAKTEAAAGAVSHECWRLMAGDADGPAERCSECGLGGIGYLRELLHAFDALRALDSPVGVAATAEDGHEDHPRAIVDSDTARVGAADSTPGLSRLASAEPGDTGPNPVRAGSSGTPGPTGGAIPPAGAKCGSRECYEAKQWLGVARDMNQRILDIIGADKSVDPIGYDAERAIRDRLLTSDPLRTLDPAALAEALKKPFDLCPRCHGVRTVGDGYMVGGLRLEGQVGGGAHEHRSPCPECSPAGPAEEPKPDLQAPATRAELEELRREVVAMIADAIAADQARKDADVLAAMTPEQRAAFEEWRRERYSANVPPESPGEP